MRVRSRWVVIGGVVLAVAFVVVAVTTYCLPTWVRYRLLVRHCPDGELVQQIAVRADGVRRGAWSEVVVAASARYTTKNADAALEVPVRSFTATLALVDATGKVTPLDPDGKGWRAWGDDDGQVANVQLPDVPDGEYLLRAFVTSRVGKTTVDAPLALYAPAKVHVLADRPLYQPGQTMQFRAVVLRARDLAPLDGRPGVWRVVDPTGETVLEEKAPAGPWGVAAGSFPVDKGAESGTWKLSWESAGAKEEIAVTVQPFTLPRFRVEAVADKRFYRTGETPRFHGTVTYSSGAPVANATVSVTWSVRGSWPMPTEWQDDGVLPRTATTGPSGHFELAVPAIPADLVGQAHLVGALGVVDAAGDRVTGVADALLAKDGIEVQAVTELGDGLADGFNNRVYLRVTTPDGQTLPGATVRVKRAWSPRDPGVEAKLDEDGVASLQLDPGPPVNVVIPPEPFRAPPRERPVVRGEAVELVAGAGASLDDQLAMDGWLPALAPCARWAEGGGLPVVVGLRVDPSGAVAPSATDRRPADRCVSERLQGKRLPPGAARVYQVSWTLTDADLPRLDVTSVAAGGTENVLQAQLAEKALDARDCLATASSEGPLALALTFHIPRGKTAAELAWVKAEGGVPAAPAELACIQKRVVGLALAEPADVEHLGVAHFAVALPARVKARRPQATTLLGYELEVSAAVDGAPKTKLRLQPAQVPPLRLRATPVVAVPGTAVAVEVIRGPGYAGDVPASVWLAKNGDQIETKVDPKTHTAAVPIAPDAQGWLEINSGGTKTRVFVAPRTDLAVTVTPGKPRYGPGQTAALAVHTTSGGKGVTAAVGLFGVDDSLGQLAALPGADDMGRLRESVTMTTPAFGLLDGAALASGRIRGANAAAAIIARVGAIPTAADLDATVSTQGLSPFDPVVALTDHFYEVLAELHAQVRHWEKEAPADEKMSPQTMAKLWQKALDACAARGQPVDDAFGRRLRLYRLPPDLLALTEPRMVVATGTRLPEDVESWTTWVAKEKP